jgi:hypothetical protein
MVAWYVDKGLAVQIAQVKKQHPGIVVGTIGDAAHQTHPSDHNPEADGSVDAADYMIGPHFTKVDAGYLFHSLWINKDPRLAYIIYDRMIVSSTIQPWQVRNYTGSDPHTEHVHVSVNDKHENDPTPWNIGGLMYEYKPVPAGYGFPILEYGNNDKLHDGYNGVSRLQALLGYLAGPVEIDGIYGPQTRDAVKQIFGGNGTIVQGNMWITLAGMSK